MSIGATARKRDKLAAQLPGSPTARYPSQPAGRSPLTGVVQQSIALLTLEELQQDDLPIIDLSLSARGAIAAENRLPVKSLVMLETAVAGGRTSKRASHSSSSASRSSRRL